MIIFATSDARMEYKPPQSRQAVPLSGALLITSTTPAVALEWRVSRGALIRIALRCLWAAVQRG